MSLFILIILTLQVALDTGSINGCYMKPIHFLLITIGLPNHWTDLQASKLVNVRLFSLCVSADLAASTPTRTQGVGFLRSRSMHSYIMASPDRMSGSDNGIEETELSITLTLRMLMHGKVCKLRLTFLKCPCFHIGEQKSCFLIFWSKIYRFCQTFADL